MADRDFDTVIDAADQSRNRTFLDQLKLAGIDLRRDLPPEMAAELLDREEKSRTELSRLRTEARDNRQMAGTQFQAAQAEYANVWKRIRDLSPAYKQVLDQNWEKLNLGQIRDIIHSDTLVLFYRLGDEQSFVLVIDQQQPNPAVIDLAVVVDREKKLAPPPVAGAGNGTVEPLTQPMALKLVTWYRQALAQKQFDRARSKENVGTATGIPAPTASVESVADILFPEQLRKLILARKPQKLVIIPDGALHNLPFEALLIRDGRTSSFVLDAFPPIGYAPSASILIQLAKRPESSAASRQKLVTLGDPQYGGNKMLKGTRKECAQLAECCLRRGMLVKPLLQEEATEKNFVEFVRGRGIVHLAAHSVMDQQYGNLFGAIALTPSSDAVSTEGNDGFLTYNEILRLDLKECELAVLSAGQTNVGPGDRPFEAGSTLAQAFLAAGVRRVVASHWSVSDDSTAELMKHFFDIMALELRKSGRLDAATALHQAKRKLRETSLPDGSDWKDPYHWVPFVLLGPTD